MRVLFLTHYFPPEVNAPASRTFEHCVRWVRAGHEVTVVTCVPNCPEGVVFPGYKNTLRSQVEYVEGVRVIRVWTYLAANARKIRRITNFVSYMLSATFTALWLPRPDVIVATSPQLFSGWAGVLVSRLKRRPLVLEIRDIWPESIEAVGAMRGRPVLQLLEWLAKTMYQSANHIVTVGYGYKRKILEKVDVADRISVISNGVDIADFAPKPPDLELRKEWGLEDKFVCSYVGTVGMAHGLNVVVEAARLLKDKGRSDICCLIVGAGATLKSLEAEARRLNLDGHVLFLGRQTREKIPSILASSDACLIHLRDCELFRSVIPSKLFEAMAMNRPIVLGVRGEARDILMQATGGLAVTPQCPISLAAALETLADDPTFANQLGRNSRSYVVANHNRELLAADYLDLLDRVVAHRERPRAAEKATPKTRAAPTLEDKRPRARPVPHSTVLPSGGRGHDTDSSVAQAPSA